MTNYNNTITDTGAITEVIGASLGVHQAHTDSVVSAAQLRVAFIMHLNNNVNAITPLLSKLAAHENVRDAAVAQTAMFVFFQNAITDAVVAAGNAVPSVGKIVALVDAALASGACASVLAAKNAIVERIFALTSLNRDLPVSVTDAVLLHEQMQSSLVTIILLVDQAIVEDTLIDQVRLTFLINDSVEVTNTLSSMLAAHEHIQDDVIAVLTFRVDGDVYTGVVINAETTGVTEYTNFPFNSFCEFGGKYYGCAADGVYRLEGSTDDGEDIQSAIRTGLLRMADGIKTRNPEAWFGYTATGDLVLKVVTTNPDGEKEQNWYKLEKRVADAPRSTRVKIGKGLSSVYWSFELVGAQFSLDNIKLFPVKLERRI